MARPVIRPSATLLELLRECLSPPRGDELRHQWNVRIFTIMNFVQAKDARKPNNYRTFSRCLRNQFQISGGGYICKNLQCQGDFLCQRLRKFPTLYCSTATWQRGKCDDQPSMDWFNSEYACILHLTTNFITILLHRLDLFRSQRLEVAGVEIIGGISRLYCSTSLPHVRSIRRVLCYFPFIRRIIGC